MGQWYQRREHGVRSHGHLTSWTSVILLLRILGYLYCYYNVSVTSKYADKYIGPLPDYPQTTVDKRWPQLLKCYLFDCVSVCRQIFSFLPELHRNGVRAGRRRTQLMFYR